jgi:hypothetical protein
MSDSNDRNLYGGDKETSEPVMELYGVNSGGIAEVKIDFEKIFQKYKFTTPQKFYFTAETKRSKVVKSGYIEIVPPFIFQSSVDERWKINR